MTIFGRLATAATIASAMTATAIHAQQSEQNPPGPAGFATVSTGTDSASIDAQFGPGRHQEGKILANIGRRMTMGDKLILEIVFVPTSDGMEMDPSASVPRTTVYSGLSTGVYEEIYLLAGDKKYMLVKDAQDKPLAGPGTLSIKGTGQVIGQWNGTFPAPPANTPVLLHLPEFSPIGPFSVPSN